MPGNGLDIYCEVPAKAVAARLINAPRIRARFGAISCAWRKGAAIVWRLA
jgi:hypothetical protein